MDFYIGQVSYFAFPYVPAGWRLCDGSLILIQEQQALFAVIGTTYGGDGRTNFALPNLIGRAAAHPGAIAVPSAGAVVGSDTVALSVGQMPSHTHAATREPTQDPLASKLSSPKPLASEWGSVSWVPAGATQVAFQNTFSNSTTPPTAQFHPAAVTSVGGSVPHENRQPFLTLVPAICFDGVFPPRADQS